MKLSFFLLGFNKDPSLPGCCDSLVALCWHIPQKAAVSLPYARSFFELSLNPAWFRDNVANVVEVAYAVSPSRRHPE